MANKYKAGDYKGSGMSKEQYTGKTRASNYKVDAKEVYGAKNLKASMTGGVQAPNLNDPFGYKAQLQQQYQLPKLEKASEKATKNINKFQEQTTKLIHNIEKQPLALPVMGRQEAVLSGQRTEEATALSNELSQINQRLGYAQQNVAQDLGFYTQQQQFQQNKAESDRSYALAQEKAAAAANPFAALGIDLGTTTGVPTGTLPPQDYPTYQPGYQPGGQPQPSTQPSAQLMATTSPVPGVTPQENYFIDQAGTPQWKPVSQPASIQPNKFAPAGQESALGSPSATTFQSGSNVELLQKLPSNIAAQVKAISEYRQAPMTRITKEGGALMQLVEMYNPSYDATQFPTKSALRKSVTSGNLSITINGANTLISHLNSLKKSFDALNNTRFPWYNVVANKSAVQSGNTNVQANMKSVQTEIQAVASEMGKVYKGTGASPTEMEIEEWKKSFSENMAPAEFKAAIDSGIELMAGKLDAVQNQYEQGMGESRDFRILSPNSINLLEKIAPDVFSEYGLANYGSPGQVQNNQPAGNIVTSPDGQQIEIID
jgi:hypothetical protein